MSKANVSFRRFTRAPKSDGRRAQDRFPAAVYRIFSLALSAFVSSLLLLLPSNKAYGQCFWQAKPLPYCQSFWFLESGPRLGTREAYGKMGHVLALGKMRNRQSHSALGVGIEFSTGSESGLYRLAIMPRYRRWLSQNWAADAALGPAVLGEGYPAVGYKGLSAMVALNYRGLFSLNAEMETRRLEYGTHTSYSMGLRFGSYLALVEIPAVLAVAVVIAMALARSD